MTKKFSQRRTLSIEHDQNTTMTNINFIPQKYAAAVGLDRSPAPVSKLTLAGTPAQPSFAPLQEKNIKHGG